MNITTEAVLRVTRTVDGEGPIPVLTVWLDPECLSWTVGLRQPARPHVKHVEKCNVRSGADHHQILGADVSDDPYVVLAELVEIVGSYCLGVLTDADEAKYAQAIALDAAHRAGQRTEHRPDLIDRDGDRWMWREGYSLLSGKGLDRAAVEKYRGPVTEVGPAETEEGT